MRASDYLSPFNLPSFSPLSTPCQVVPKIPQNKKQEKSFLSQLASKCSEIFLGTRKAGENSMKILSNPNNVIRFPEEPPISQNSKGHQWASTPLNSIGFTTSSGASPIPSSEIAMDSRNYSLRSSSNFHQTKSRVSFSGNDSFLHNPFCSKPYENLPKRVLNFYSDLFKNQTSSLSLHEYTEHMRKIPRPKATKFYPRKITHGEGDQSRKGFSLCRTRPSTSDLSFGERKNYEDVLLRVSPFFYETFVAPKHKKKKMNLFRSLETKEKEIAFGVENFIEQLETPLQRLNQKKEEKLKREEMERSQGRENTLETQGAGSQNKQSGNKITTEKEKGEASGEDKEKGEGGEFKENEISFRIEEKERKIQVDQWIQTSPTPEKTLSLNQNDLMKENKPKEEKGSEQVNESHNENESDKTPKFGLNSSVLSSISGRFVNEEIDTISEGLTSPNFEKDSIQSKSSKESLQKSQQRNQKPGEKEQILPNQINEINGGNINNVEISGVSEALGKKEEDSENQSTEKKPQMGMNQVFFLNNQVQGENRITGIASGVQAPGFLNNLIKENEKSGSNHRDFIEAFNQNTNLNPSGGVAPDTMKAQEPIKTDANPFLSSFKASTTTETLFGKTGDANPFLSNMPSTFDQTKNEGANALALNLNKPASIFSQGTSSFFQSAPSTAGTTSNVPFPQGTGATRQASTSLVPQPNYTQNSPFFNLGNSTTNLPQINAGNPNGNNGFNLGGALSGFNQQSSFFSNAHKPPSMNSGIVVEANNSGNNRMMSENSNGNGNGAATSFFGGSSIMGLQQPGGLFGNAGATNQMNLTSANKPGGGGFFGNLASGGGLSSLSSANGLGNTTSSFFAGGNSTLQQLGSSTGSNLPIGGGNMNNMNSLAGNVPQIGGNAPSSGFFGGGNLLGSGLGNGMGMNGIGSDAGGTSMFNQSMFSQNQSSSLFGNTSMNSGPPSTNSSLNNRPQLRIVRGTGSNVQRRIND